MKAEPIQATVKRVVSYILLLESSNMAIVFGLNNSKHLHHLLYMYILVSIVSRC
jgi:hypothetical protein